LNACQPAHKITPKRSERERETERDRDREREVITKDEARIEIEG